MNQKKHKAIAEIIKSEENLIDCIRGYNLSKEDKIFYKDGNQTRLQIALRLADYFEKEEKKRFGFVSKERFNKEQFLKECGVDEK